MSPRWQVLVSVQVAILAAAGGFLLLVPHLPVSPAVLVLLFAAAASAAATLSYMVAYRRFVGRRLDRWRRNADRLAGGDTTVRFEGGGDDELSSLAAALDLVVERTASVRRDLEARVAERTEDLRALLAEVHERSRIAEEVNRSLTEAERRKAQFLTNVSHELRTPLNSILGFLRLVEDGMYESEEERNEFLGNAKLSASHLLQMVTDVLSAARLDAGTLSVQYRPVDPAEVVADVLRMLEVRRREKQFEVRVRIESKCRLTTDEAKLRQILLNLVGNAFKHTDSGLVEIVVRPVAEALGAREPDGMRFEVRDTGDGIPPEELDRVFERFHQVERRSTRAHEGTGLGLSVARDLVDFLGGEIGVHSDGAGTGALFHFTLPLRPAAAAAPTASR